MKQRKHHLNTDRLVLKKLEKNDKKSLILIMKSPLVNQTYMVPELLTPEKEDVLFNKLMQLCESDKHFAYGIYIQGNIIGYIHSVSVEDKKVEVGYFIDPDFWNQGYASEALKAIIDELFRIGFKTIICGHFIENVASGRVMKKCGMHLIEQKDVIEYKNKEHVCVYYEINMK